MKLNDRDLETIPNGNILMFTGNKIMDYDVNTVNSLYYIFEK